MHVYTSLFFSDIIYTEPQILVESIFFFLEILHGKPQNMHYNDTIIIIQ